MAGVRRGYGSLGRLKWLFLLSVLILVCPVLAEADCPSPEELDPSNGYWQDITDTGSSDYPYYVRMLVFPSPSYSPDGCSTGHPYSWSFLLKLENITPPSSNVALLFQALTVIFKSSGQTLGIQIINGWEFDTWFSDDPSGYSGGEYGADVGPFVLEPGEYCYGCLCAFLGGPLSGSLEFEATYAVSDEDGLFPGSQGRTYKVKGRPEKPAPATKERVDQKEGAGPFPLTPGVPVYPSLAEDDWVVYSIEVPADTGALNILLDQLTGDLDLTLYDPDGEYADGSYNWDTDPEYISYHYPQAGTWEIEVYGYESGSGRLTATLGEGPEMGVLENGTPQSFWLDEDEWIYFSVEIPSGAENLTFTLDNLSDDLDLYVAHGYMPTYDYYDCRPYYGGASSETCFYAWPQAGTWYVGVNGYEAGYGQLTATWNGGGLAPFLSPGRSYPTTADVGQADYYGLNVPSYTSSMKFVLEDITTNLDLYVAFGYLPGEGYDYSATSLNSPEVCQVNEPSAGDWYVGVDCPYGYGAGSGNLSAWLYGVSGALSSNQVNLVPDDLGAAPRTEAESRQKEIERPFITPGCDQ